MVTLHRHNTGLEQPADRYRETVGARKLKILSSLLFDSKRKAFVRDITLIVDLTSGIIEGVKKFDEPDYLHDASRDSYTSVLDLRGLTVLPGFVDAHTHIFLHPYSETPSLNQARDESLVERVVRGTNHARWALQAGFTTYRDLGTEGLSDADVSFRDTINRGIIPGPRVLVATEALASSSSYELRYESKLNGTIVPRMSDPCDGADGVRAAVRRRIGAGADIIKFYADYRRRVLRFPQPTWPGALPVLRPPSGGLAANPNRTNFTQDEMNAIVEEANRAEAPVAAHAMGAEAVTMAAKAGVTSIEHGTLATDEALQAMKDSDVIFVPTISILENGGSPVPDLFDKACEVTKKAYEMGVRIAAGGDLGAGAGHGTNAREMELLHQAGLPVEEALAAGTLTAWQSCGGDRSGFRFGWLGEGWSADIVAIRGDPRQDFGAVRQVEWVIKDGRVVVRDGRVVT